MLPSKTSTDFLVPSLQLIPPPFCHPSPGIAVSQAVRIVCSFLFLFLCVNPYNYFCGPCLNLFSIAYILYENEMPITHGGISEACQHLLQGACGTNTVDQTMRQACGLKDHLTKVTRTIELYQQIRLLSHDSCVPIFSVFCRFSPSRQLVKYINMLKIFLQILCQYKLLT